MLVDGVFVMKKVERGELERVEQLVGLRVGKVEEEVEELREEVKGLKGVLVSNGLVLEMPEGFMDSLIVDDSAKFITLSRFFSRPILKLSLLYRASSNNFSISRFHE